MAWVGWHTISPPMRAKYQRFVELANEGARELGFADLGEHVALAATTCRRTPSPGRARPALGAGQAALRSAPLLRARPPAARSTAPSVVPARQARSRPTCSATCGRRSGANIYPIWSRRRAPIPGYRPHDAAQARKATTPSRWCEYGEGFFTSLGLAPLPETFWERSLFTEAARPRGGLPRQRLGRRLRRTTCASRCASRSTSEDFVTIHHELGHNYYQRAYNDQPLLFRDSANDGFHEALGDTIALSITPELSVKLGLLDQGRRTRRRTSAC